MIRPALMILAALGALGVFLASACNGSDNSANTTTSATHRSNFSELAMQSGLIGKWNGTCTIYYVNEPPQTYTWFEFRLDGIVQYGSSNQPTPKDTDYRLDGNSKSYLLIHDWSGEGGTFTEGPQYSYHVSGDRLTMIQQWKGSVPSCNLVKTAASVEDEKAMQMQRSTPTPTNRAGPLAGRWNGPCEIEYSFGKSRTYDWIRFRPDGIVVLGTDHPQQTEERGFGLGTGGTNPGSFSISPSTKGGGGILFKIIGNTLFFLEDTSPAKRCTLTRAA